MVFNQKRKLHKRLFSFVSNGVNKHLHQIYHLNSKYFLKTQNLFCFYEKYSLEYMKPDVYIA